MTNKQKTVERLEIEFPELYVHLYKMIRVRIPHKEDAEEVVSKTIETMIARAAQFDVQAGTLGAWATGIAKNHILHYWRDKKDSVDLEEVEYILKDKERSVDGTLDYEVWLSKLPPEDRALLVLRYVDGYSAEELARSQQKKAASIRQRLHRIKKVCRELIQ